MIHRAFRALTAMLSLSGKFPPFLCSERSKQTSLKKLKLHIQSLLYRHAIIYVTIDFFLFFLNKVGYTKIFSLRPNKMLCYVILIWRIKWMCLTFLLLYLESLLSFSVQVFQVLRPAALNENILLVVLWGCIMDCQPLLVFIHLGTSCWYNKKK